MFNNTIHIAYALNDSYTEITCVSMASILHNTNSPVHFHVVESRLSDKNKNILQGLKDKFSNGKWSFHTINDFDESAFEIGLHNITHETYYRLRLPEILSSIDKVIYLDGDTIVDNDIIQLWEVSLNDVYLAAVPNIQRDWYNNKKYLGLKEDGLYFNAGVLVLNLQMLREFDLYNKAKDIAPKLFNICNEHGYSWLQDQDVLNYFFCNDYFILPVKYNYKDLGGQPERGTLSEWREAIMNPVIIHYAGATKPDVLTKEAQSHPLWEKYYKYKAMTQYADVENDNTKVAKYRQLERQIENALIVDVDKSLVYKRHDIYISLLKTLPDMLKGKKLALWGVGIDTGYIMVMLATKDIYADVIVDGLIENHGNELFHYTIQDPQILQDRNDEYLVLLCMRNEKPATSVIDTLKKYGYSNNSYHHVYAPIWNRINDKKISKEMTDIERYELLKDRTIDVPLIDTKKLAQIDIEDYNALEQIGKGGAFKILRKIGDEFGVFKEGYTTQDLDVEFRFSKGGLHESIFRQKGMYQSYVKMMTVFDSLVLNAIGIEVHGDRYNNPDSKVDCFYTLISAFYNGKHIVPVLLEIKTYTDKTTPTLYVAVSMKEINRSRIVGYTPDDVTEPYPIPASFTVSLTDFISNVNTADSNLLKYVPDGFLNDEQKEAKQKALKETAEYIDKKNRQRMAKAKNIPDGDGFVSEPFIDYQSDEYDIVFIYRRVS